jgi:CheY-like chemotaxis protein
VCSARADDSTIFLVEDDENDAFLFQNALKNAGIAGSFTHIPEGEEAINYLTAVGNYVDRLKHPFPSVLITDLKMPKISGFELLAWIQNEIQPRSFPVIVLSASNVPADKPKALALGAVAYWAKPSAMTDLTKLLLGLTRIMADHKKPLTN